MPRRNERAVSPCTPAACRASAIPSGDGRAARRRAASSAACRDIYRRSAATRTASTRSADSPGRRRDAAWRSRPSRRIGRRSTTPTGSSFGQAIDVQLDQQFDHAAAAPDAGCLTESGHAAASRSMSRPRQTISPSIGPAEVTSISIGRHDRVVDVGARLAAARQSQGDLLGQPRIAAVVVGNRADGARHRIEVDFAELVSQQVLFGQRRRPFRLAAGRTSPCARPAAVRGRRGRSSRSPAKG